MIENFFQGTFFSESNSEVRPCEESLRSLLPYITKVGIRQRINEFNVDAVKEALNTFQQIAPQKVFEAQAALCEFQVRSGQNFDDILEQTKAEILGLLKNPTLTGISLPVVLRLDPDESAAKLSAYANFAHQNYHELVNFLNKDHKAWIDTFAVRIQTLINEFEQNQSTS
ncbi:MAG: hypothetical protein LBF32_02575 [Streptococcaceae bacterium]|nr:hypothetical protein [Streptococcaceae bacterium]